MLLKIFSKNKMGNCKLVRERFSEYVDRLLPYEEQLEVHEHLNSCKACTQELDDLCKTISLLADFRQELPQAINTFRVPRSIFAKVEYFPTLERHEDSKITLSFLAPYFTAFVVLCLVLSTFLLEEHWSAKSQYNSSNYVEVLGN
jgi:anti-sigma factor RsiW